MPWRMAVQQGPSKRQRQAMPSGMTVERRPSRYRKRRVRGGQAFQQTPLRRYRRPWLRDTRQAACLLQHPHQCSFFACKLFFESTPCVQFAKLLERLQDSRVFIRKASMMLKKSKKAGHWAEGEIVIRN